MDKMVPPMVEALLFPVKLLPLGEREIRFSMKGGGFNASALRCVFLIGDMLSVEAGWMNEWSRDWEYKDIQWLYSVFTPGSIWMKTARVTDEDNGQ